MKITNKGLTMIYGALDWADMLAGNDPRTLSLSDVEINQAKGARKPWSVMLDELDLYGEGDTFDEAAEEFYLACKVAANSPAFDEAKIREIRAFLSGYEKAIAHRGTPERTREVYRKRAEELRAELRELENV
jgi:hypothetical protein